MTITEEEVRTQTHPPDQEEIDRDLIEQFKDLLEEPPSDCPMCHTRRTRPCDCGGRIHNEMQGGRFVECCFSCGGGVWRAGS